MFELLAVLNFSILEDVPLEAFVITSEGSEDDECDNGLNTRSLAFLSFGLRSPRLFNGD